MAPEKDSLEEPCPATDKSGSSNVPQEKAGNVPSHGGDALLPEPSTTAAALQTESGAPQGEGSCTPATDMAPRGEDAPAESDESAATSTHDEALTSESAETPSPDPEGVEQDEDEPERSEAATEEQAAGTQTRQDGVETDAAASATEVDSQPQRSDEEERKDVLVERIASAASAHAASTPSEIAEPVVSCAAVEESSFEPTDSGAESLGKPEVATEEAPAEAPVAQEVLSADDREISAPTAAPEDAAAPGQNASGDSDTARFASAAGDAPPQLAPVPFDIVPPGPRHRGEDIICMPTGRDLAASYAWIALRYAGYVLAGYLALIVMLVFVYRFVNPPASTLMVWRWVGGAPINQTWVPIERISPNLVRSVIVAEDARFCQHWGIDLGAMKEAIENARDGLPRGASTISMQVVKNVFLWPSRSFLRKVIEIPVTLLMELVWPKHRVLEVYLNVAEWAPGVYGAEAAARHHFKRPASRLSARQAALLAAALPNPFRRDAGDPGPRTYRKARVVQARARASKYAAQCVLAVAQRRSKR